MAEARRLSTRDRKLAESLRLTEEELAKDIAFNHTDYNVQELLSAINSAKNPKIKQMLTQEYETIQTQIAAKKTQEPATANVAVTAPAPITIESVFNAISSYFTK